MKGQSYDLFVNRGNEKNITEEDADKNLIKPQREILILFIPGDPEHI